MFNEVKYMYIKNHCLAGNLLDAELEVLAENARIRNLKKGESVYLADGYESRIYFVLKGKIKISEVDDSGNELIREILHEGDVFGDVSLDGDTAADELADVLTDLAVVCSFRTAEFKRFMQHTPTLAVNYAKHLTSKLRRMENKHSNLVFKDAKGRLISFFKEWASREGDRKGNKIVFDNYLTHNDIASIISTSRQSVTTLLNELRDCGMLFYNRKKIELNELAMVN